MLSTKNPRCTSVIEFTDESRKRLADLRTVLINRLTMGYETIDFTISNLNLEQLHHHVHGSQLGTPASIYLHVAWVADLVINHVVQGGETVYDSQGWAEKMPNAPVHPGPSTFEWAWAVQVPNTATLKSYADAVRPGVIEYINGLSDADLDRMVPWFGGEQPLCEVISYLLWDLAVHTGEIAALRGIAGMKGLPF
jgi:hypothetical protein